MDEQSRPDHADEHPEGSARMAETAVEAFCRGLEAAAQELRAASSPSTAEDSSIDVLRSVAGHLTSSRQGAVPDALRLFASLTGAVSDVLWAAGGFASRSKTDTEDKTPPEPQDPSK